MIVDAEWTFNIERRYCSDDRITSTCGSNHSVLRLVQADDWCDTQRVCVHTVDQVTVGSGFVQQVNPSCTVVSRLLPDVFCSKITEVTRVVDVDNEEMPNP